MAPRTGPEILVDASQSRRNDLRPPTGLPVTQSLGLGVLGVSSEAVAFSYTPAKDRTMIIQSNAKRKSPRGEAKIGTVTAIYIGLPTEDPRQVRRTIYRELHNELSVVRFDILALARRINNGESVNVAGDPHLANVLKAAVEWVARELREKGKLETAIRA